MYTVEECARMFAERIASEPVTGAQRPCVFYVGGFVRDRLWGVPARDVDSEVYGVPFARIETILRELKIDDAHALGKAFGIMKVRCADGDFDIALPRTEKKTGGRHTDFAITGDPYLSFSDALRRRDFTMNALLQDVLTGEIIDPFGGQDDCVQYRLRVVDERTFAEDALRVYRAIQFVARFRLSVDEQTRACLARVARHKEITLLSADRITEEWKKLFVAEAPHEGLLLADDIGLLARYEEMSAMKRIAQDPSYHPEGAVWEHVLSALSQPLALTDERARLVVRLAIVFHDAGKLSYPAKTTGHAQKSAECAQAFFARLRFSQDMQDDVLHLIAMHERLPLLYREVKYGDMHEREIRNALRMLYRDVGAMRMDMYFALCRANAHGRGTPIPREEPYVPEVWARTHAKKWGTAQEAEHALLRGEDVRYIAQKMGKPVPEHRAFGALLRRVEDARDAGDIVTKADALTFLQTLL